MAALIRWSWVIGVLGVLLLLGGAGARYALGTFDGAPTWLVASGGVALVAYALLDRDRVGEAVQSRQFTYGSGASVLVLLAGALAVGSYALARRNDHTFDLTRDREFSLSDHARQVASGLSVDVAVTAFFRAGTPTRQPFVDLARRFGEVTPRLKVEYVDPLQEPLRASEAEITGDHGTVILKAGDRTQRLEGEVTEEEFVRALVMLQADTEHKVCWSLGHGEPDPDDEMSEDALGAVRLGLEELNYTVAKVRVAQEGVPRDCEALLVVRPAVEWFPYEREALAAYLAEGGRALVMLDPGMVPDLADELERFGVLVGDDVVVDLNLKNQLMGVDDPSLVVLSEENFGMHPVTRSLHAALVLPIARSVRVDPSRAGLKGRELLHTSEEAWGETDPGGADIRPDEGLELIGRVPVMAVVEIEDPAALDVKAPAGEAPSEGAAPDGGAPSPERPATPDPAGGDVSRAVPADFAPKAGGRLVVLGDSDFASNRFVLWGNNRDLFLNVVAWLVDEEDQIGERPSKGDTLEISAMGEALLCLGSLVVVPGSAVVLALLTLIRRRFL